MTTLAQVLDQMAAAGLPPPPPGHPICDGKVHRYGPKKKAWYLLREIALKSGEQVIGGAFGIWQGAHNNAVKVAIDWRGITAEERAEAEARQREVAAREQAKRQLRADNAANRARLQWRSADGSESATSCPYLQLKGVAPEGVRITADGTLLVPMVKYDADGAHLAGLQKIAADGSKRFNKGMDKAGASLRLGKITDDTDVAIIAEGYATAASIRMATERRIPVVVAFDAGNLLPVATTLRIQFPALRLLFAADDDYQLEQRYAAWLDDDFQLADAPPIDGQEHAWPRATDGELVTVTAHREHNEHGVPMIVADARCGRIVTTRRFENAGVVKAREAAHLVGNAAVTHPVFADRGERKLTDFNDLHVEEGLDAVRRQIEAALRTAHDVEAALSPHARQEARDGSTSSPGPSGNEPPIDERSAPPAEQWASSKVTAILKPTLEMLLEHFSLVYGTSDVWDSLNRRRIKKAGFIATVGKDLAKTWLEHADRRTIDPESLPILRRGQAIDEGGGKDRLLEMLDKLTLLYGTVTVWDSEKRMVMSLDAVRAAYGTELVKRWQEHRFRKMIDAENLVFDPTQRLGLPTHINMFHGYPLTPTNDDEKCLAVLELLYDLCGGEENAKEIGDWLVKWLAYPLQHPGAKMQTAVLMFGEKQGTGKSLLFEGIVRPIYGEYGGTAGQHQLDSTFTDWKSRKTFMVFEEVLSRDDRYSHIGTLKHMITGRDMRINPKGLPERVESNHLNSVFLSNESQPIPIELEDRRFLVIEARNKLDEERVRRFRAWMEQGLSSAFYYFLLNYPLGDFNPHTKPLMTEAKRRIIRFGRPGWDAFHEQWKEGDLPAPYCSCLSDDLYKVYIQWCERNHERKLSLTRFSELIANREPKGRKRVLMHGWTKEAMRTVFQVDSPDYRDKDYRAQCQIFRDVSGVKDPA